PWAPAAMPRPAMDEERPAAPPAAAPPIAVGAHDPGACADLRLAVAEYEKAILAAALERCRWNQRAAAAALSVTYDQLRHAMRRHQMQAN
ncbi:MAG TPA: helix-turn-helix domain-containing protein, partial [Sphingomonas sp.]